jgi:LPXTG-motif cell wall-anchored protein
MKKIAYGLAALAAGLGAALFASPAHATPAAPSWQTCTNLDGWHVNDDEISRKPTPTTYGLKFEGNQLIHHAVTGDVEHLAYGSFVAHPSPDQPSFFSVEVYGSDGGYATLRWDVPSSKWVMVTGGQLYTNTSPAALVDMVTPHESHHVVSFGVGYTANSPGTVATVVSSVRFGGKTYDLTCRPRPSHSASAPASPSSPTAPASPTRGPGSPTPSHPGSLPVTGPGTSPWLYAGAGVTLLGAGGGLVLASRRRRNRFEA